MGLAGHREEGRGKVLRRCLPCSKIYGNGVEMLMLVDGCNLLSEYVPWLKFPDLSSSPDHDDFHLDWPDQSLRWRWGLVYEQ